MYGLTNGSSGTVAVTRVRKRLIVCCDGTWQDGVSTANRQSYTNILRIARTIHQEDRRSHPPTPQIVFYQSGIGSEKGFYSEYIVGTTGSTLADKVEEAYAFIAHNFYPGDEIFLFGFSRGAYTARMTAALIGAIGVLDRTAMDNFASIFLAYQKLGKSKDQDEITRLQKELAPWTAHGSPGKQRADSDNDSFSIKFVGVFDTVGSLGLPEELTHDTTIRNIFGFSNCRLGEHIQYAYQALALNEPRADFNCCKFEQTPHALQKGQILRQCWFTGGGYKDHDLADMTLFWMAANVEQHLSLDYTYLGSLPQPVAPWGSQQPHDPCTGIFALAHEQQRTRPAKTDSVTHETIHQSVLQQHSVNSALGTDLADHPSLVRPLLPLEDALRQHWTVLTTVASVPSSNGTTSHVTDRDRPLSTEAEERVREKTWLAKAVQVIQDTIEEALQDN
ncbi:hypothetical protein GGX14DRAFT_348671 [Mycena pura]|uniref:T6SS Phospholipase effector Tle1-like catalytic domain-containing protein n=1 Tax=Mycena pura TaxID=153505 RepID=A0AAD6YPI4_9AGAR|nr:hypothetical protein GGX14DRAFT_348671 [Mycena pura]